MARMLKLIAALALTIAPALVLTAPAQASKPVWAAVSAGASSTCAIRTDHALFCWGNNEEGQLGTGDKQPRSTPRHIGKTTWSLVSTDGAATCAIRPTHSLYCWGSNSQGQLGAGPSVGGYNTPHHIGSLSWLKVSMGDFYGCGITTTHKLYCWGAGSDGQLGNGTTDGSAAPERISSPDHDDWSSVSAQHGHTCAIRHGGELYCWGYNGKGQVGDGTTDNAKIPVKIGSHTDWTSVAGGEFHTCAVRHGHTYCWGANSPELGLGPGGSDVKSPTVVGASFEPWATVSAETNSTCALRSNHTLYCWGANGYGQIGDGAKGISRDTPRHEALKLTDWKSVSVGDTHACAIRSTGTLYCWGSNGLGQLGIGTTDDRDSPRKVS